MSAPLSAQIPEPEELVGRRIALISVSVGIILAAAKIVIGSKAGSNAVVSDGIEASGDVLSSTIVYAGLWLASKPPDAEHPYGHGRYETLAGLAVGAMLLLSGAAILWHGLTSLHEVSNVRAYAMYPLFAAVLAKIGLASAKFRVGKKIDSSGLQADAWHDITDLLSTSVALIAVVLTLISPARLGSADRAGGVLIGVIILFLSVQVVRRTIDSLLDTMPEPQRLKQICDIALAVEGSLGIEKCLARRTGLKYHVDLHLEVDPNLTVRESHEIATRVKFAIKENLRWVADVLVHVEPCGMAAEPPRLRS
ncbi:MAG: cation diffusion facilitator family transporter [Acidobacteriota bacterium]|nr:cation diffusion facilitator family transporter [Acidobacteriota bacterium]